jgi:hypothetical protein
LLKAVADALGHGFCFVGDAVERGDGLGIIARNCNSYARHIGNDGVSILLAWGRFGAMLMEENRHE